MLLNNKYLRINNLSSNKFKLINNLFYDVNTNMFKSNQITKSSLNMNKCLKNYKSNYINFL